MGDGASVAGDGRSYRGPPPPAPSPVRRSGNAPAGAPQLTGDRCAAQAGDRQPLPGIDTNTHPPSPLTCTRGYSEADDDIIAFYKAKKELQARMGRK